MGTGDGRAVLEAAVAAPRALSIGLDANAAAMAESSRRATRPAAKGGRPNAMFFLAAAEAMPSELDSLADLVTVRFPWGSLLRGCVGADAAVAAGLARLVRSGGALELLLAPADRDGLAGVPTEPVRVIAATSAAFASFGFVPEEARGATDAEIRASRSTWARRLLGGSSTTRRPVTFVRLRSSTR